MCKTPDRAVSDKRDTDKVGHTVRGEYILLDNRASIHFDIISILAEIKRLVRNSPR